MEIRLIKTFQAIVKLGSFQRAAEALQYSQPTVTVQIKKLEDELGVKLFDRGKKISLTSAGRFFLEKTESLLREYDELNNDLSDFLLGDSGLIRIGASEPSASNRIPQILSLFTRLKPKVQIKVMVGSNNELMRMLLEDSIDLALCNRLQPHLDLEFHPMLREPFGLLVPEDHPLANKENIHIKHLKDEKFLMTPGTCAFRIRIEEIIAEKIGRLRQSTIEIGSITSIKYYVQAKLGIALAPLTAISPAIPGTVIRTLVDMFEGPELGLLTKRNSSPVSNLNKLLWEEIRNSCSMGS